MDGLLFDVSDAKIGVNFPPLHPGCRSITLECDEGAQDAVALAPKLLDDYSKSISDFSRYGSDFKPSVTSVAVDATNTSRAGFGSSGIYLANPSIDNEHMKLNGTPEYVGFHRRKLSDEYIDEMIINNPSYLKGKDITSIKKEMGKLRALIQKTKDVAKSQGKYYDKNVETGEPSMQKSWLVENCAEIWAVRDAILQGAKIENLVLRSWDLRRGKIKPFCDNCSITFEGFMTSMD
nr:NAD+--asparagine ADP-ribosyltransferase [Paenibacillus arenosi]